jgi:hypothetical protein
MGFFSRLKHAVHKVGHAIGHTAKSVVHHVSHNKVVRTIAKPVVKVVKKTVHSITHNKATRYIAGRTKIDDILKKAATQSVKFTKHAITHPIDTLKHLPPAQLALSLAHVGAPAAHSYKVPAAQQHQAVGSSMSSDDRSLLYSAGLVGIMGIVFLSRR